MEAEMIQRANWPPTGQSASTNWRRARSFSGIVSVSITSARRIFPAFSSPISSVVSLAPLSANRGVAWQSSPHWPHQKRKPARPLPSQRAAGRHRQRHPRRRRLQSAARPRLAEGSADPILITCGQQLRSRQRSNRLLGELPKKGGSEFQGRSRSVILSESDRNPGTSQDTAFGRRRSESWGMRFELLVADAEACLGVRHT